MTLAELNACPKEKFVETLGWVFEHSPWVAERAVRKRPFTSFDDLSVRLILEVQSASPDEQLALLRAQNPSESESDLVARLHKQYHAKFGYPFLFAVKDSDTSAVVEALQRRLKSAPEQEFQVALGHVFRIARFRLEDTIRDVGA